MYILDVFSFTVKLLRQDIFIVNFIVIGKGEYIMLHFIQTFDSTLHNL